jgi:hypothetical protein
MGHGRSGHRTAFSAAIVVALMTFIASTARGGVMMFSRTFEPGELPVTRFQDPVSPAVYDTTRASIHGPTSAGGGDEVHISVVLHNSALRFEPVGTAYFVEAYLFNNGGLVNPVSTADIAFAGVNVNGQAGTLDYEQSNVPSWRGSKWATRTEFLTNPAAPGQVSRFDVTFTIPAGYPVSTFDEVYMNIGVYRQLSFNQSPGPMMMSNILIPEPTSFALIGAAAAFSMCSRRSRGLATGR